MAVSLLPYFNPKLKLWSRFILYKTIILFPNIRHVKYVKKMYILKINVLKMKIFFLKN